MRMAVAAVLYVTCLEDPADGSRTPPFAHLLAVCGKLSLLSLLSSWPTTIADVKIFREREMEKRVAT